MSIILGIIAGVGVISLTVLSIFMKLRMDRVQREAERIVREAREEAENYRREARKEIMEERLKEREFMKKDIEEEYRKIESMKEKLKEREAKLENLEKILMEREQFLLRKEKELNDLEKLIEIKMKKVNELIKKENEKLEKIALMTKEQAKKELLKNLEREVRMEASKMIREIKENAKKEADKKATEIILEAIQRCAISHWAETTVDVVPLESDDIKGRIIGREGRNIRTFEKLTGVEVLVDDSPEVVTLSAFDPIRLEKARIAMEKLVKDGRIHPARIEEIVQQAEKEIERSIMDTGEEVIMELSIDYMHPELKRYIGMMKFRTSYGQNLLQHSREVAYLSVLMASELKLDTSIAKRAGLLHDLGKAAEPTYEGPHALIGAEIAAKYGEPEEVVHAIMAHHEDVKLETPYDFIVQAADAISGARPGARRESFDLYIKRLEKLEEIASSCPGIVEAYAVQAGRELRVLVNAEEVSDDQVEVLAEEVAKKIEESIRYAGQIKVVVIREKRAISYAK